MTAARVRGSKRIRSNSERGKVALEGLEPVVDDWHTKVCFLGVSMLANTVLSKYIYHAQKGALCMIIHSTYIHIKFIYKL